MKLGLVICSSGKFLIWQFMFYVINIFGSPEFPSFGWMPETWGVFLLQNLSSLNPIEVEILFYRIALDYTVMLRNEASATDEKDNLCFNMTEFEKRLQRKAGQQ